MKKILAIIASLVMCLSLVTVPAMAADTDTWDGNVDTTWYNTTDTSFTIDNAEKLAGLAKLVNDGTSFNGKTVTLATDLDLANLEWTPIGNSSAKFQGNFDGDNHVISNLLVTSGKSYVGLFGFTTNGEVKNLTVENAKVTGRLGVGVIAGSPYTSKLTNITLKGHVEVNGMSYVGGVGGRNAYANWTDITVDVDETSYVKATSTEDDIAYRTYVGGVVGFIGEGGQTFKNIVSNINVIGDVCDIGGITGIAHYNNKFENVKCTATVTNTSSVKEDGEETGGIAGVWHNEEGTSVTFKDCKFEGKVIVNNVDVTSSKSVVGAPYIASNDTSSNSGSLDINGTVLYPTNASIGGGILVKGTDESGICFELVNLPTDKKHTFRVELFAEDTYVTYKEITLKSEGILTCTFYTVGTSSSWKQDAWAACENGMPTHAVFYIDGVEIGSDKVEFTEEQWKEFPGTAHVTSIINAKEAKCTEKGYTGDVYCEKCENIITEGEDIKELGHKTTVINKKDATCTEEGYTGDEYCEICEKTLVKGNAVKATGHTFKDGKCSVCGEKEKAPETGDTTNVLGLLTMLLGSAYIISRKRTC